MGENIIILTILQNHLINKDHKDLKNALLIVYSEQYGPWCLAVNRDGSVVLPGQDFLFKTNELFFKILEQMDKIDRLEHGG